MTIPTEWYFITPPQSVSIQKDSNVTEIDAYGTNNPYLQYGTTKLRKLSLGGAMIEGFSDGKSIEGNIRELEKCMHMIIDNEIGYVAPYCWEVYAGNKSYGTYIITSVGVNEEMRDNSGNAVRANVDVGLTEVSPYQIATGEDITSEAIQGGFDEKYDQALKDQDDKVNADKDKGKDKDKDKNNNNNNNNGTNSGGDSGGGGGPSTPVKDVDKQVWG
jgi:hypothetical protein